MKKFARIENDIVVEVLEAKELPPFHKSLEWVEITNKTKEGDMRIGKSFSSPRGLETPKTAKKTVNSNISAKRSQIMADGFEYRGNVFQIGSEAQSDMLAVQTQFILGATNPHGGFWRSLDNKPIRMSDDEVKEFFQAAFAYVLTIKKASWTHKENIANMKDKDLIKEYDINIGWT